VRSVAAIAIACLLAGWATYWAVKLLPVLPPMVHMLDQPRLSPQRESAFFRDGFGMRPPVEGTVARGHLPYPFRTQDEAAALVNPLPRSAEVLKLGKKVFTNHCAVCHGALGDGTPTLTQAYGAKPANLIAKNIAEVPDGKIYHAIAAGKSAMPSYAADISEDERWAAAHYVRVLERSQNATEEDLK
jgi:mono/diheme cytochrome c family protein